MKKLRTVLICIVIIASFFTSLFFFIDKFSNLELVEAATTAADTFVDSSLIDPVNSSNYTITGGQAKTASLSYTGTGDDGTCTVSTNTNINTGTCVGRANGDGVNFSVTSNIVAGNGSITLSSTPTGLTVGDEILLINLQGTSSSYSDVGEYEFATISQINSNTLTLDNNLTHSYDGTTQKIMVQRVPQYTNVTVNLGFNFYPSDWDGTKGGVITFRATGSVTVNGTINADTAGYTGGAQSTDRLESARGGESFCGASGGNGGIANSSGGRDGGNGICGGGGAGGIYLSNSYIGSGGTGSSTGGAGGGGGTSYATYDSAGGAGGGGYGTFGYAGRGYHGFATNGGTNTSGNGTVSVYGPSINAFGGAGGGGGTYGSVSLDNIYFGSGGGGGGDSYRSATGGSVGGGGGGIVFISADTLAVEDSGSISSAGEDSPARGAYAGGGGGGAGGSIKIYSDSISLNTGKVGAAAGISLSSGDYDGGDGGSGRIRVEYISSLSGTSSPSASTNQFTPDYEDIAIIQSKDIVSASDIFPISFVYNLSAKPVNTSATIQFSNNGTSWYNSSGSLGDTNTLSTGEDNEIDLSSLSWTTSDFYYKVTFGTNSGANTPVLDDITLSYETIPTAPTIGTATVLSDSSIRWGFTDNANNETGFKLYSSTGSLLSTKAIENLSSIDETGLTANTQYTRKISTYNVVGNSAFSSAVSKYTHALVPALTCSDSNTNSINLDLNVYTNPIATEIEIYERTSGRYVNVDTGTLQSEDSWGTYSEFITGSSCIVTGLDDNTSYSFQIKAKNGDGTETSLSSAIVCTTDELSNPVITVTPPSTTPVEEAIAEVTETFEEITEEEVAEVTEILEEMTEEGKEINQEEDVTITVGELEIDTKGKEVVHIYQDSDLEISIPIDTLISEISEIDNVYAVLGKNVIKLILNTTGDQYIGTLTAKNITGEQNIDILTIFKDSSTEKSVLGIYIDPYGYVYALNKDGNQVRIKDATVSLHKVVNEERALYTISGQENPQTTDVEGQYSFMVEPGIYVLVVEAKGYKDYDSGEFEVEKTIVEMNIEIEEKFNIFDYWFYMFTILIGLSVLFFLYNKSRHTH